jgi:hypothetical protein
MGNVAAELGAFEAYLGNTFIGLAKGTFERGSRGRNSQHSSTSCDDLTVLVERCAGVENGHSCTSSISVQRGTKKDSKKRWTFRQLPKFDHFALLV